MPNKSHKEIVKEIKQETGIEEKYINTILLGFFRGVKEVFKRKFDLTIQNLVRFKLKSYYKRKYFKKKEKKVKPYPYYKNKKSRKNVKKDHSLSIKERGRRIRSYINGNRKFDTRIVPLKGLSQKLVDQYKEIYEKENNVKIS